MSSLRDELQAIYDRRGELTPELVLDEARAPEHPLHGRFEWDDGVAAERWRRHQAHELIQAVTITYAPRRGKQPRDIRAFQAVRDGGGFTYKPTEEVARDPVLSEIVRRDMERDWRQLKARYDGFSEFSQMVLADLMAVAS